MRTASDQAGTPGNRRKYGVFGCASSVAEAVAGNASLKSQPSIVGHNQIAGWTFSFVVFERCLCDRSCLDAALLTSTQTSRRMRVGKQKASVLSIDNWSESRRPLLIETAGQPNNFIRPRFSAYFSNQATAASAGRYCSSQFIHHEEFPVIVTTFVQCIEPFISWRSWQFYETRPGASRHRAQIHSSISCISHSPFSFG